MKCYKGFTTIWQISMMKYDLVLGYAVNTNMHFSKFHASA